MENLDENKTRFKRRSGTLILLLLALILACTNAGLLYMYHSENNFAEDMERRMDQTNARLSGDIDSMTYALSKISRDINTIRTGYDTVFKAFSYEKERKNQLARLNNSLVSREKVYDREKVSMLERIASLVSENDDLRKSNSSILTQILLIRSDLDSTNLLTVHRAGIINDKNEKINANSLYLANLRDSILKEKVSGYFNTTYLSRGFGLYVISVPFSRYFIGFSTVNGFVINRNYTAGLGFGLYNYNGGILSPLFLDFRFRKDYGNLTPYIFADGGLLLNYDDFKRPLLFLNPGIGLSYHLTDEIAINLGTGLFVQKDQRRSSFLNLDLGFSYYSGNRRKR